jgi:uncharacterized membrane protein (DUF485 family)
VTNLLANHITLEHGATAGLVMFAAGAMYMSFVVIQWASTGFAAAPVAKANVAALTAIVLGIQLVFTSFFLSLIAE